MKVRITTTRSAFVFGFVCSTHDYFEDSYIGIVIGFLVIEFHWKDKKMTNKNY